MNLTPHQKEALKRDKHISLTANAGSGKTFVLVKRYLDIAIHENVQLSEIVAITFTEKAASELYKKIATEVENRILIENDSLLLKKLNELRHQLVSANVSTIHSFCINLLKEFPVEAEIDANFTPIDEIKTDELIELAIMQVIRKRIKNNEFDPDTKKVIRLFGSVASLANELKSLIENRKNVDEILNKIYCKNDDEIKIYFNRKFEEFLETIVLSKRNSFLFSLNKVNNFALNNKSNIAVRVTPLIKQITETNNAFNYLKLVDLLSKEILTTNQTIRIQDYIGRNAGDIFNDLSVIETHFQLISNFIVEENNDALINKLISYSRIILNLYAEIVESYTSSKKENGFLDFEDILLLTKSILTIPEVLMSVRNKFKYIMVDEYQDTNEIQYKIFLPLLDYLRTGNLFIVGDEKQSIYMFRDAELEVFNKTKNDISCFSGPSQLLTLPESFRMSPIICAFTNRLFKVLFSNADEVFNEVKPTDIVCIKENELDGKVEILLEDEENESEDKQSQEELIARKILQLVNNKNSEVKVDYNDIAILTRKRKNFSVIEKALNKFDIPFTVVGGKGFYQQQIVIDVYNYFSFLLNPKDDGALIGLLRSPFFFLPDSTIFDVNLENGNTFFQKLKSASSSDKNLYKIVELLTKNLGLVNSRNIILTLREIVSETNYLSVISSRENGEQEVVNFYKLISVSQNYLNQGFRNLYDYVSFLKNSIDNFEDENLAEPFELNNTVKLMTIHQSKGLEYKAVFIYACNEKSVSTKLRAKQIEINKEFGLLIKVPENDDSFSEYKKPSIVLLNDYIAYRKNLAELKRLFYVAITRTKNYLFFCASKAKNKKFPEDSFLNLLLTGLSIDLTIDSLPFEESLKYLKFVENSFLNHNGLVKSEIKVTKHLDLTIEHSKEIQQKKINLVIKPEKISDEISEEIISATKYAIFNQCPIKYHLTYDIGFLPALKFYNLKKYIDYLDDFNPSESDNIASNNEPDEYDNTLKRFSALKGSLIHSVLEKNISYSELDEFLKNNFSQEFPSSEDIGEKLIIEIKSDILKFYNSKTYLKLMKTKNSFNEFPIYVKENDYFLFGIVDKLIIEDDYLHIIDFKTDDIDKKNLDKKIEHYKNQLNFYAYLLCKKYTKIKLFSLQLIFIKNPEIEVVFSLSGKDLKHIGDDIHSTINSIRHHNYIPQKKHCSECVFSKNNFNCILS